MEKNGENQKAPSMSAPAPTPLRQRATVALLIGVACALFCYARLTLGTCAGSNECEAGDFTWAHRGIQQLLAGQNPYHDPTLGEGNPFPRNDPLFYPMPALLMALPFAPFPRELAGALFMGVSCGLLAFGLFRNGFSNYALFLSAPFWFSLIAVQWSPLLVAAALLPTLLPLTLAKPNIGLPIFLSYPTWRGFALSVGFVLVSLLVLPSWPLDWLNNASTHAVFQPVRVVPGFLLLLAALRWRRPEARLLLLLALIPQRPIYDQLALWLVAQRDSAQDAYPLQTTRPLALLHASRPMVLLSLLSWLALSCWLLFPSLNVHWIVWGMYLPALVILLVRKEPAKELAKEHAEPV
jgi:hypothetical protein